MIIIGADFVPTKSNYELFKDGNIEKLFGKELLNELNKSDYRIFNLETPLCNEKTLVVKAGEKFFTPTSTGKAFEKINVNLFTLANNHILDQGEGGLESTKKFLNKSNIAYVGAGDNLKDAAQPFFFEIKGKKYGVYACAEHEFSIATNDTAGANPFDPLESLDHIQVAKKQCDYLIVLYHGGKEYYRYPSPLLQKTCRKIVEKGANLVICQHSHCIGCEEKYLDGTIVYGQGNFLFDNSNYESWQTGLLVKIEDDASINYISLMKNGNTVRKATGIQEQEIIKAFRDRTNEIKKDGFVEKKYQEFSEEMLENYIYHISGKKSLFLRMLDKLTKGVFSKKYLFHIYREKEKTILINYIECESHRELFLRGLKNK